MVDPVVHFEIPVDDPKRAKAFYEKMFGWKIEYMKDFDYYSIKAKDAKNAQMSGIDGGMMKRKHPGQPAMNYIHVASIEASIKKGQALGAKLCMPKTAIGEMGWIAAIQDPDGNMIGLHAINKAGMEKMMAKKAAQEAAAKKSATRKKKA